MHWIFISAGVLALFSNPAWAWQEDLGRDVQQLVINADRAQITLTNGPGPTKITTDAASDANYQLLRKIPGENPNLVRLQKRLEAKPGATAKFEITGRSLPVVVHAIDGGVSLNSWSADALVHLQHGHVTAKDGTGNLTLSGQKGELQVFNQTGRLWVEAFANTIGIHDVHGDTDVQSFSGEVLLEHVEGAILLQTNSGQAKVVEGGGSLQFDNIKGALTLQHYQGRIEGQVGDGTVHVLMAADEEVSLKSQNGRVVVATAPGNGTWLNVNTNGDLALPAGLKAVLNGNARLYKGRTRGGGTRASVQVQSNEGAIVIK